VDEVALVVDESSLCYLRTGHSLGTHLLLAQLPALQRIGAPVGHYLTADLGRITDRKVFLLPTSFAPTAADRAAIDALKCDGHVLVFLGYPGLYRDGKVDEQAMADLTGIRLRLSNEPAKLEVRVTEEHPLTVGLAGSQYGVGEVAPYCYVDDPAATVLGALPTDQPGLVVKRYDDWTAIYSSAPMLPATLLRNIAQAGGAHLYIDTADVVWASQELLAVCVKEPGKREIRLPRTASVKNLYNGTVVGEGIDRFTVEFGDRATWLFSIR
jgi:hypothetical protein